VVRGRVGLACYLLGSLPACAQILGVDDYSKSEPPRPTADPPFDEKPPYLTGARCQLCIEASCSDEQRACGADAACSNWLNDMRSDNFGPIRDYLRRYGLSDASRAVDSVDGGDPPAPFNALISCLNQRGGFGNAACQDYCQLGRDFSCTRERFEWPPTEQGRKELRVRLVDENAHGLAGWQVRYCGTQSCELATDAASASAGQESSTDAQGFASLGAEVPDAPAYRYLLASAATPAYPFRYQLPSGPLRSGIELEEPAWSKRAIDAEMQALGIELEPTTQALAAWVFPRDCRGDPARGVTIDVLTTKKGVLTPCPETDCLRIYPGADGYAEAGQSELSFGPRALVTNLPATTTWLVVRDRASQVALAAQKFEAQRGTVHVLTLYPASGAEQDQLDQLPLP
jgi:hypothetical protein